MKKTSKLFLFFIIANIVFSCGGGEDDNTDTDNSNTKKTTFKIASYNMRVDSSSDKYRWADTRKYLATDIIKKYKLDILGTQELYEHQVKDVLIMTDDVYAHLGVATGNGQPVGSNIKPTESFDVIFYRKSRFTVLQTGDFWYSETPNSPSMWSGAGTKTHCTWAKFKDKDSEEEFYVLNSHLEFVNQNVRDISVDLLLEKVKEIAGSTPVFCTGDFNADMKTTEIKKIANSGFLKDSKAQTFKHSDTKNGGTFSGFEKNVDTDWRIDFVFVSNTIEVNSYAVITDDFKFSGCASDHLPVYIEARIKKK